jgi:hypothetical protein
VQRDKRVQQLDEMPDERFVGEDATFFLSDTHQHNIE